MTARILIVASSDRRAQLLAEALPPTGHGVDTAVATRPPRDVKPYRLLVWEGSPRVTKPGPLLERVPEACHVVLILPELDVRWVSYYMADSRINHFFGSPFTAADLRHEVDKLASGKIFGLERYLPESVDIRYHKVTSFDHRCQALDAIDDYLARRTVRGKIRRAAGRVAEELLMNAMYNAPVDEEGCRVFEEVDPGARIQQVTPQPVSVRYVEQAGTFYLSVRDRFGSFQRDQLAHYLLRCVTDESPIEGKKRGAGLGLFQIATSASRIVVNILPGSLSEFVCVLDAPAEGASSLRLLSVTTGRPTGGSL